jgi:hypothetical protein
MISTKRKRRELNFVEAGQIKDNFGHRQRKWEKKLKAAAGF